MPTLLITGASRGLGLELTREFARRRWRVLACCRAPQEAGDLQTLAAGLAGVLLGLRPEQSGTLIDYQGNVHPW